MIQGFGGFGELSHKTRINPICYHLNTKKKYHLEIFSKSNHIILPVIKIALSPPSRLGQAEATYKRINFKPRNLVDRLQS